MGNPFAGLTFTDDLLTRPTVSAFDVEATLEHFAIVSYAVPPDRVRPHVHSASARWPLVLKPVEDDRRGIGTDGDLIYLGRRPAAQFPAQPTQGLTPSCSLDVL